MFTDPNSPLSSQDEVLRELDHHLVQLEQGVIQEYRRLLAGARKGVEELLKFPAQVSRRFQQILAKLQSTLEGSGDRSNLRIVTEFQEELRIRMLVLDHLLDRDIPFAYLERAFNPAVHRALFVHPEVERHAAPSDENEGVQPVRNGPLGHRLFALFRRERQTPVPKKAPSPHVGVAHHRGSGRRWFHSLPDYLRVLFLLHHCMENDELRLLRPAQRVPTLGRDFLLNAGVAVFDAADRGEYHWRTRAERPKNGHSDAGRLASSMREKLMRHDYTVGVRSQFRINGAEEGRKDAPGGGHLVRPHQTTARTPEELRRKLQHLASPCGVRAAFGEQPKSVTPAEEVPWAGIDFEP